MNHSTDEIRERFLEFFAGRGHTVVAAAPLVPDDPTLLFTAAGMVQFKGLYQQTEGLPYTRATSVQPCLRVKDLEKVGRTLRHHTLFEMLGNFSFGDYFKREAIRFAWEFMTEVMGVDGERLWVSVFREDDEAAALWSEEVSFPSARIVRLDERDNFWGPVGATGVCGPSSEVYYDTGEERSCGRPSCAVGCDCDRYIEVWNLVFPQYFKTAAGDLDDLPNPGIDTGMGLERMAFILQGVEDNYHTDVFGPLLECVMEEAGLSGEPDEAALFTCKVAAEHARALAFPIAEGVFPSNEGRGYVLRRLLRRALTRLQSIGVQDPLLYKVTGRVADVMGSAYPQLERHREQVAMVVRGEEERFLRTLRGGLEHLDRLIETACGKGRERIRGEEAFYLYDTMGFPLELTEELALERGLAIDHDGFDRAMEEQRTKARGASRFGPGQTGEDEAWIDLVRGEPGAVEPYGSLEVETRVLRFRRGSPGGLPPGLDLPAEGNLWEVVLEASPFYPVGGGQEADRGVLEHASGAYPVLWTVRREEQAVLLVAAETRGNGLPFGDDPTVVARVSADRRRGLERNHTATHLLHAALRALLGEHVTQAGSLVARDRLRFDFSHFEAMSREELREIERIVNCRIRENIEVVAAIVDREEAMRRGAMALFGEKYGDRVRLVSIGDVSLELCGGTHLERTGSAGPFVIVKESSAAAGVRRIEALTGPEADEYLFTARDLEEELAVSLKADPRQLKTRVAEIMAEVVRLKAELRRSRSGAGSGAARTWEVREVAGVRVAAGRLEAESVGQMRGEADRLRERLGSGAGLLVSVLDGKPIGMVVLTRDLPARGLEATALLAKVTEITGGGGGGQPLLAQGRIANESRIDAAIAAFPDLVKDALT